MSWVLDTAFSIHTVSASYFFDKYLYVGNEDYSIRVWNTLTSSLYRRLQGHTGLITSFAFDPRHDLLFSAGLDGCIITWHGSTMVAKYQHHKPNSHFPASIHSLAFSYDSEILIAGLDGQVATFQLSDTIISQLVANSNSQPFTLRQMEKLHDDKVTKLVVCGRKLFSASFDRTIVSSQLIDLRVNRTISRHQTAVSSLIFDSINRTLIAGDHSGAIRAFTFDGLSLGLLADKLDGSIQSLFYDETMQLVWFVLATGDINLMDPLHPGAFIADNFQIFNNLPVAGADTTRYECVLGNQLNTRILAIVNHKYVYCWKWDDVSYIFKFPVQTKAKAIYLLPHSEEVVEYPRRPKDRMKHTVDFEPLGMPQRVNSSLVSPGLNLFCSGCDVLAFRPTSRYLYKSDQLSQVNNVVSMSFSYFDAAMLMGTEDGQLIVSSLCSPNQYSGYHTEGVRIMQILVLNQTIITVAFDQSIVLWRINNNLVELYRRDRVHEDPLTAAALAISTGQLLTCDDIGLARIWIIDKSGLKEEILLDHRAYGGILAADYSLSTDSWITANRDGLIRAYPRGNPLHAPLCNVSVVPCNVTALAAGIDRDVYVAVDDKTIRLLKLENGEEKGLFEGHTDLITQIFVPNGGDRWASLQWNGVVYFWALTGMNIKPPFTYRNSNTSSVSNTSRLPRITRNSEPGPQSSKTEEPMITLFEKSRKNLLLKRRQGENELKALKRSPEYRKISQMTVNILEAMKSVDRDKRSKAQSAMSSSTSNKPK